MCVSFSRGVLQSSGSWWPWGGRSSVSTTVSALHLSIMCWWSVEKYSDVDILLLNLYIFLNNLRCFFLSCGLNEWSISSESIQRQVQEQSHLHLKLKCIGSCFSNANSKCNSFYYYGIILWRSMKSMFLTIQWRYYLHSQVESDLSLCLNEICLWPSDPSWPMMTSGSFWWPRDRPRPPLRPPKHDNMSTLLLNTLV